MHFCIISISFLQADDMKNNVDTKDPEDEKVESEEKPADDGKWVIQDVK